MKIVQRIPILLIIICVCIGSGYTQNNCGLDSFQCRNGQCIDSELLCDGKADCKDSSDETENECKKPEILCSSYSFRCDYGACINGDSICDNVQHCVDNSDEKPSLCNKFKGSNNQTGSHRNCKENEYRCANNQQCIDITEVCDGIANCVDGSDETFQLCGSLPCPITAFRCEYGACIDGDLRCNGIVNCVDRSDEDPKLCGNVWPVAPSTIRPSSTTTRTTPPSTRIPTVVPLETCTAPAQPKNGHWKLYGPQCSGEQYCNVPEGTKLGLGSYLMYSCNPGYKISDPTAVICSYQGQWQPVIPICKEILCEPLDSASIRAECKHKNKWISCKSSVPPDTSAVLSCENSYRPATSQNILLPQRKNVICNENGRWEPEPIRCVPVCGTLPFDVKPTIVDGYRANITEFPWHATMYREELGVKKFICGASIIQENLLMTAAHCVFDENTRQLLRPSRIYILTGNIFRDYDNSIHNPNLIQRNQVKQIYIDRRYLGLEGNFLRDIAILELVIPFTLSATLVPVCIDTLNDRSILEPNSFGKVAGFGRTASGESSAVLQALTVPVIAPSQCWSASKNAQTQRYFTNDKFCAGYTNGSAVCDGDSGGGLVFQTDDLWYLRGIVSVSLGTKEEGGTKHCDNNLYTLYTDVSRYITWIQEVLINIERNETHLLCSESTPTKCS